MSTAGNPIGGRGRFITFEGGEGAGKSTQIRLLARWLRDRKVELVETREPGGSEGAERIRGLLVTGDTARWTPLTETLLHYAARADHLERTIRPTLASGRWVLCDRFADSTKAYQGHGHGVAADVIDRLFEAVVGTDHPDLTFILDVPVVAGLQRAKSRASGENRYEQMSIEFHERLRVGFLEIARLEPTRCVVIDASGSVEAIQAEIRASIIGRLRL